MSYNTLPQKAQLSSLSIVDRELNIGLTIDAPKEKK